MPRIFISYRRADSKAIVGWLYEHLERAFGADNIFMDVDDIPPGVDFRAYLQNAITEADVVLIIIGPKWASILKQRRNDTNDFVRIELESALEQRKITIPILVDSGKMPLPDDLPKRVSKVFPYLNAATLGDGPSFRRDVDRLIAKLQDPSDLQIPPPLPSPPVEKSPRHNLLYALFVVGFILLVIVAAILINQRNQTIGLQVTESLTASAETLLPTPIPTTDQTQVPSDTLSPTLTTTLEPSNTSTNLPLTSTPNQPATETAEAVQVATAQQNAQATQALQATLDAQKPKYAEVTVNIATANLHTGPGTDYGVLGTAERGETFQVAASYFREETTWYRLVSPPAHWIASAAVTFRSNGINVPTADNILPSLGGVNSPYISSVAIEGDCNNGHTYVINWTDPNNDATYIDYLNPYDSSAFYSERLSGGSGQHRSPTYTCPTATCGINFVVFDQEGNKSSVKAGAIRCN
jgi:TIR domain